MSVPFGQPERRLRKEKTMTKKMNWFDALFAIYIAIIVVVGTVTLINSTGF